MSLTTFVGTIDELAFTTSEEISPTADETALFVRICKKRVRKERGVEGMSEVKINAVKLGVGVDGGFQSDQDKYDTISTYSIVAGKNSDGDGKLHVLAEIPYEDGSKNEFPTIVSQSADSVICHAGLAVMQDLTAWELDEEPKPVSKYLASLPFVDNGVKISQNPSDWKVSYRLCSLIPFF